MSNDRGPGDEFVPTPAIRNRYHPGCPHDFVDAEAHPTDPSTSPAKPATSPDPRHAPHEPGGSCPSTSPATGPHAGSEGSGSGSRQEDRPERPGAGVQSDSSGKTQEGITGVSGETGGTESELGDEAAT